MITIDCRSAGSGKTTDIIKRISKHYQENESVLLVVPSINLQHEIHNRLHSTSLYSYFKIINSENNNDSIGLDNTASATLDSMRNGVKLLCITHATFINLPQNGYRGNYHLYIDEALDDVIRLHQIHNRCEDTWKPDLKLVELYRWNDHTSINVADQVYDDEDTWMVLDRIQNPQATLFSDSHTFRNITHHNYLLWVTPRAWSVLNNRVVGSSKVITMLDSDILGSWASIHITAAAFENTLMSRWMKYNNIKYSITHKFVPHTGNIHIHAPPNGTWSMNKLKNNPEMLVEYHSYVDQHRGSNVVLAVRNNITGRNNRNATEIRLPHNVHGMNSYVDYSHVSLETALQPDPQLKRFITHVLLTPEEQNNHYTSHKIITDMYAAYRFYQIIMRGKLRVQAQSVSTTPYHIYLLDSTVATCLLNYLEIPHHSNIHDITHLPLMSKQSGRKKKYITDEEKRAADALRKRNKRNAHKDKNQ